jgi:hypothetical protein
VGEGGQAGTRLGGQRVVLTRIPESLDFWALTVVSFFFPSSHFVFSLRRASRTGMDEGVHPHTIRLHTICSHNSAPHRPCATLTEISTFQGCKVSEGNPDALDH